MAKVFFDYGDVSSCSFRATKLFHTGEGGAMFANNAELHRKLFYHHNFGHKGKDDFYGIGINAKISELQAAMGLAVLPHLDFIIERRKAAVSIYKKELEKDAVQYMHIREATEWNYSYFPVILHSEEILNSVLEELNENNIYPRRYFYPSLNTLEYIEKSKMPHSENISKRILCLPLSHEIEFGVIEFISAIINQQSKR